jgi:hypothetical protein
MLVAPRRVDNLTYRNLAHVARDDTIYETRGIFSTNPVFKERGDIDQRSGIANSVVLVFMMRFVGTDGVITGPLAIVQTFAELKCSFVKGGSDWHGLVWSARK